jgi:hypothetical protein
LLQKVGQGTVKASKLGTEIAAVNKGYQAAEAGYNKAYDLIMPSYDELIAQQQKENLAYLNRLLKTK